MQEYIWVQPLHQLYIILSQFKWSLLEINIAWWIWNHKTKINVYDVTHVIHKYIIIMPIFY